MLTKDFRHDEVDAAEAGTASPDVALIREHLDVVLASDEFSSSRRASELLQHLVERALTGDSASLKERLLGVEIFHRRSDYNTSTDAIVRVTANDVRRRLAQFYSRHPDQPLRISLPLGSYVPDFIAAPVREPDSALASAVHISSGTLPHPELLPIAVIEHPTPPASPAPAPVRVLPRLQYALGLILAVLVGWWFHSAVRGHSAQTNSAYSFYNDLLGPIGLNSPGKTEIALTNPHVLLYLGLNNPGPALGAKLNDIPVPPRWRPF